MCLCMRGIWYDAWNMLDMYGIYVLMVHGVNV